jgi:hypothetical protein
MKQNLLFRINEVVLNPSFKAAEATTLRHWAFQLITSVLATTPFLGPSVN